MATFKVTQKAIKEAPSFIIGIDYKASYKPLTIELIPSAFHDMESAMEEAQAMYDEKTVWCIGLYRKTKEIDGENECACVVYRDCVTCWNGRNWTVSADKHTTCKYSLKWKEAWW